MVFRAWLGYQWSLSSVFEIFSPPPSNTHKTGGISAPEPLISSSGSLWRWGLTYCSHVLLTLFTHLTGCFFCCFLSHLLVLSCKSFFFVDVTLLQTFPPIVLQSFWKGFQWFLGIKLKDEADRNWSSGFSISISAASCTSAQPLSSKSQFIKCMRNM